jgi:hypothetical protein
VLFRGDAGPKFQSIAELHKVILERDEGDAVGSGGVSLRSIMVPHSSKHIIFQLVPNLNGTFQNVPLRTIVGIPRARDTEGKAG